MRADSESLLYDLRGDDLARSAPGSKAVEDEESVLLLEGLVEVGLPRDAQTR